MSKDSASTRLATYAFGQVLAFLFNNQASLLIEVWSFNSVLIRNHIDLAAVWFGAAYVKISFARCRDSHSRTGPLKHHIKFRTYF